jgi:hypothetical protein
MNRSRFALSTSVTAVRRSDSILQHEQGSKRKSVRLNIKVPTSIFVCTLFCFSCFAQPVTAIATDSLSMSSSTKIALEVAGGIVITTALIHYDQDIYNELHGWKEHNVLIRHVSPVVTNIGDGIFPLGLFVGFAGYGWIAKDNKALEVGKIGLESFFLTGISIQILKTLCGRERPSDQTRPGGFWHGPFANFDKEHKKNRGWAAFDSFPSGHTATVFAAATTLSDFYTDPWVSYTCYSLASIVAVTRVMESTHWLSDCFVGAIIGHYGTRLVEQLNYGSTELSLVPLADEYQYGLLLSVKF